MEKIQITLASQKTQKVISENKRKEKAKKIKDEEMMKKQAVAFNNGNLPMKRFSHSESDPDLPIKKSVLFSKKFKTSTIKQLGLGKRREVRARECYFNMQVQNKNTREADRSIERVLSRHDTVGNLNDKVVNDQLQTQQEILKKRLEDRKNRYIYSKSITIGLFKNHSVRFQVEVRIFHAAQPQANVLSEKTAQTLQMIKIFWQVLKVYSP